MLDNKHKELAPRDIAVLCHSKRIVKHWASLRNHGVYVDHFDRMKGLEFKHVFVPHLENAFTTAHDAETTSEIRRRIFTAMTRARQYLVLSYSSKLPNQLTPIVPHVQQFAV